MFYINNIPTENGNYGNPQSNHISGWYGLPNDLLSTYLGFKGFVYLTVDEDNIITAIEVNQEALDAYNADHPDVPEPEPEYEPTADDILNVLLGVE